MPGLDAALRAYIRGCLRLGGAIMRGLALGLGLPEGYFGGEQAGDSYWVTRLIYYPPLTSKTRVAPPSADGAQQQQQQQQQLSCGEHTGEPPIDQPLLGLKWRLEWEGPQHGEPYSLNHETV